MEREILFRGKYKISGQWVYGDLAHHDEGRVFIRYWRCGTYASYEVDPATVSQYTGLTDRARIKVFEGDCCTVTKPGAFARGFITFYQGCFLFEENNTGNLLRLCDMEINGYQLDVRGNIHDNPELLEAQNDNTRDH